LNYEVLQELLKEEEEKEPFSGLPFQWLEISTALLDRLESAISNVQLTQSVRATT